MAKEPFRTNFQFGKYHIPVFLHKEIRNSLRFSIGKKGLIIRSPFLLRSKDVLRKAEQWCVITSEEKPQALHKFLVKTYPDSFTLILYGSAFEVQVIQKDTQKDTIKWNGELISIMISKDYQKRNAARTVKDLLVKFAAKRFLPEVRSRVQELNERFFNVDINQVRLKYNHSNWGSCSIKGNINLSARLLLAPREVLDYVIIHELAHRIEMNHSRRFWAIVREACPRYRDYEQWLKKNSHLCDF